MLALIDFSQIKGSKALLDDVQAIKNTPTVVNETFAVGNSPVFTITNTPTDDHVTMDINGIVYKEPADITVDRQTRTVTWTSQDFNLTTDIAVDVEISYKTMALNIIDNAASQYPLAEHVYGMVLVETNTNGGNGTWVRINRNFEEIEFSDEHGTWKNINIIDDPTYGKFVEFPITWVRSEVLDHGPYNGKTCYWTADGFVDGFHIHPAFIGADGDPRPLQIAAYMASNKNDIPFSQDKNNNYENYWYNRTYKDWNELKWVDNQLRLYTIYDHHFLARLMLTEFGTPDVQRVTVNGIYWGGANRINYHGVIDPMGLLARTGPVPCCYALFGIAVNADTKTYKVMANDGSLQLVETNINVFTSGDTINYPSAYINTCYVTTDNGVDFGDMFIMETGIGASNSVGVKATDAKGSFGGDTQGNGVTTNPYLGTRGAPLTWSNNGSQYEYGFKYGMFSLMGCSETGTRVMVRTCRCS